jgi:hypothetical protein
MGNDGIHIALDFHDDCMLSLYLPSLAIVKACSESDQAVSLKDPEVGLPFDKVPWQKEWMKPTSNYES